MYCKDYGISLGDETYTVILNAACTELQNTELGNFLRFVKTGEATNPFTNELLNEVTNVKHTKKWEVEYMTLLMRDKENRKEERKIFARLIMAIPQDSDDYNLALTSSDDEAIIKALYKKYGVDEESQDDN